MIGNRHAIEIAAAIVFVAAASLPSGRMLAEDAALTLRGSVVGAATSQPLTIEVFRWSTDAERAPLLTALAPPPAPPAAANPPAAGRAGAGGRAGGRGGRGGAAAPPASPAVRLSTAVKAAPTVGFIWGEGPTGYAIKYAWRSPLPDGQERIVLVSERRLGAHNPLWPPAPAATDDAEFTVIEMRLDRNGTGEAKSSLTTGVVVDADAKTLALEDHAGAPALLTLRRAQGQPEPSRGVKVTR